MKSKINIKTNWGIAQATFNKDLLLEFHLPEASLKNESPLINLSKKQLTFVNMVKDYYAGKSVNFNKVQVDLSDKSPFFKKVYEELQKIEFGKIITYSDLANLAKSPKAVQAVGQAMAKNKIPLIIPCHRVIKKDGKIGGFSASGGTDSKIKMLDLEKKG